MRVIAIVFLMIMPTVSVAESVDSVRESPQTEAFSWQRLGQFLVGSPARNSVYGGMWSYHFIDNDDDFETAHYLAGLSYKGYFGGVFRNSQGDWAVVGGAQRDLYRHSWSKFDIDMGYRLGIMNGYDNMQLYDTGFFPLLQLYIDVSYEDTSGVQFSWAGSAFTAGFFVRF